MLAGLPTLNGDRSVLDRARELLKDADDSVRFAIDYLQQTADLMWQRYGDVDVHFDLGELQGYHYKTGVVFAAFVPQLGQAIARGGRYDDIGKVFGRARAATGFSTDLKVLSQLSQRRFQAKTRIYAPASDDPALQTRIAELRSQGNIVVEQLSGQIADAEAMACDSSLRLVDGAWIVE